MSQAAEQQRRSVAPTPLWLEVLLVVGAYWVLHNWAANNFRFAEPVYACFTFLPNVWTALVTSPVALALIFWIAWRGRRWILLPWRDPIARGLGVVSAVVLAWAFSLYAYNGYYDRWHGFERLALVCFAGASAWRPVFLLPLVMVLNAILGQFDHPLPGNSWTDKSMPLGIITVFAAAHMVAMVWRRPLGRGTLVVGLGLMGGHYWVPAVAKLRLQWVDLSHVHYMVANTFQRGWLGGWTAEDVGRLVGWLEAADWLVVGFTLLVEAGAVAFLVHRRLALLLLAGWVALHVGIFVLVGTFFLKWILIDLALAAVVWRWPSWWPKGAGVYGAALVVTASWWCAPPVLGWYTTPLSVTYHYDVEVAGQRYSVAPDHFAPYDLMFSQDRFGYLSDRLEIARTNGSTKNPDVARLLTTGLSDEQFETLLAAYGRRVDSAERSRLFDHFVRRSLSNRKPSLPLAVPPHLWTDRPLPHLPDGIVPEVVRVHRREHLFTGDGYRALSDDLVRTIRFDP